MARAAGLLRWSETYAQPFGIQMENFLYPKIEFFLRHGQMKTRRPSPGS